MKKLIVLVSVAVLALSSCKKDHTCECTVGSITNKTTIKETKKKAKETCEKGNSTVAGIETKCELK